MDNFKKTLLIFIMVFASSVKAMDLPLRNQNIVCAIEEMQKANYFTFVMLLNIAPPDLFAGNVTFLIPTDRMLANAPMSETAVADFLLRHSIPSPLFFEDLIHFPTGSLLPTTSPALVLKVTNNGRQSFFLNNVRIRSPNICTSGSSVRCHGIDGVLQQTGLNLSPQPSISQTNNSNPSVAAPFPSASPPASTTDGHTSPDYHHQGARLENSGSHPKNAQAGLLFQIITNVVLVIVPYIICST